MPLGYTVMAVKSQREWEMGKEFSRTTSNEKVLTWIDRVATVIFSSNIFSTVSEF